MAIVFYDSAMIGEIAKSKEYREEPYRIRPTGIGLVFHGKNHEHYLTQDNGHYRCDCDFFAKRGLCSHIMTVEWLKSNPEKVHFPTWLLTVTFAGTQPVL